MRLHDEKPSVAPRPSSWTIDLVIREPRDRSEKALTDALVRHGLAERSQTIVWLDKFTVRLIMWRRQYLANLSDADWARAAQDIEAFLREVHEHYRPRLIQYDTRAFSVGLHKPARRRRMPVDRVVEGRPGGPNPVWWDLVF
ncbi:MAG: hypothetical protein K6V97_04680 [Actinomycetia bacterium]|nr:hypothetical protein [Actinomycetes bacterium]